MANYRELVVWQKSMVLVQEVYKMIKLLPKEELFSLSAQLRRAVVSIPSNITEGHARGSDRDFARFLTIGQGSRAEVETQLEICIRLGYIPESQAEEVFYISNEVERMLYSMIQKLSA